MYQKKNMICSFCKKEYKIESRVVTMFGTKMCVHDERAKLLDAMDGVGDKNDSLGVKVARSGKNKTEEDYIQESKGRGNTVVRGSDGLLREIEQD